MRRQTGLQCVFFETVKLHCLPCKASPRSASLAVAEATLKRSIQVLPSWGWCVRVANSLAL
jgi:hypothetical protein